MKLILLSREEMARTLERLASEIVERHGEDMDRLLLVGIQRRGGDLARRLTRVLKEKCGRDIPLGTLDINLYRDDWTSLAAFPSLGASSIPLPLEGRKVLLVDDVLYTGRTARAAIEAVSNGARAARIQLAVLVDRGHREIPIRPDYTGKNLPTSREERVSVRLTEVDGADNVVILSNKG